jgi:hypothetical protein
MSAARRLGIASALLVTASAMAQEAPLTPSATQPSPGSWVVRTTARLYTFTGGDAAVEREGFLTEERLRLALGITKELSVEANMPFFQASLEDPTPAQVAAAQSAGIEPFDTDPMGLGDLDLTLKLRLWKEDLGPVDTMRVALFAGTEIPTSTAGFGSRSFDPIVGIASTTILGRHGIGTSLSYRFTTDDASEALLPGDTLADLVTAQAAYLYRIAPEEFGEAHVGAWYVMAECIANYETNGDIDIDLAPGLLYEGPRFAFEAGVILPIYRELDHRPETGIGAYIGLRFLF